jgi:hypothetical protein
LHIAWCMKFILSLFVTLLSFTYCAEAQSIGIYDSSSCDVLVGLSAHDSRTGCAMLVSSMFLVRSGGPYPAYYFEDVTTLNGTGSDGVRWNDLLAVPSGAVWDVANINDPTMTCVRPIGNTACGFPAVGVLSCSCMPALRWIPGLYTKVCVAP